MGANPILGVFLSWLDGLAAASIYVPFGKVRRWSWETYWLAVGVVSGICGTLVPPIFHGQFGELLAQRSGIVTLVGVALCALGIILAGAAGVSKENELYAAAASMTVETGSRVRREAGGLGPARQS